MKEEKKKYTFEEWKQGKVSDDELAEARGVKAVGVPLVRNEEKLKSDIEFNQVRQMQEKAFDKAVMQTVEQLFNFHKQEMNNAIDPGEYIKNEIAYHEEKLEKNRVLTSTILKGKKDFGGFTAELCNKILSSKGRTPRRILWPEDGELKRNRSFDYMVDYKLKQRYENLYKQIKSPPNIDIDLLQQMVGMANELHINDWDYYKPGRGNPIISIYVKRELSQEFEKGVTTIHDWFNDYCEKTDRKTIHIKAEVIASLKSG